MAPIDSKAGKSLNVYPKDRFFNRINEPSSMNSEERFCVFVAFKDGSGADVLLAVQVFLSSSEVPKGILPSRPIISALARLNTSLP